MKLTKRWQQEYIEYSITMVRPDGRLDAYYNGASYRSRDLAQSVADKINASRDHAKYGAAEVSDKRVNAGYVYEGRLAL